MIDHRHSDVAIVGGGIIGCAIAYYLSNQRLRCSVFDSGSLAGEASQASAGMLAAFMEADAPGPLAKLCIASQSRYAALAKRLYDETGIDIGYSQFGTIGIARNEAELSELKRRLEWFVGLGQAAEWLEPAQLRTLEPALADRLLGGVHTPSDHSVSSYHTALAFAEAAKRWGTRFYERTPVYRLLAENGRVIGVETAFGRMTADFVVVAAGSWSPSLLEPLHVKLPVYPVKGQCYSVILPFPLRRPVFAGKCYAVPKPDGTVVIGATQEEAGFDKKPTAEAIATLHETAKSMIPGMKDAKFVRTWAGLRPGNPNRKPIIGPVEGWEGLYVATGHFRKGTLLAPATGEMMASLITGFPTDLDAAPFAPKGHGLSEI